MNDEFYILTDADAHECVSYAASELGKYLLKATGREIPVVHESYGEGVCFSVGRTSVLPPEVCEKWEGKLCGDGFAVFPYGKVVAFLSRTPRGIAYAVYDYLERFFGIRFLTADCEYVPLAGTVRLPDEPFVSNPSLEMRTYLTADIFQEKADLAFLTKTRTRDVFTPVPEKFGGGNKVFGREANHNFHCYVPFEKYGNDHPEFYLFFYENGEINHTVDLTSGIAEDGSLDESVRPSVASIVIEELKKDVIKHPEAEIFNFTQEDGNHYFTDERNLDQEKKYKRSGMLIRFCNAVVRALNEWSAKELNGRRIRLVTFAYSYAKEAPVRTENGKIVPIDETVVADENLIVQLALFQNAAYDYFSERQRESVKKALSEWGFVAKRFWFWGYDCDFRRYLNYFGSFGTIGKNVRGMIERGITYLCINGPYESATNWQANLRAYVYRKLMWDSSLSEADLQTEFIDLYYGKGAPAVKEVLNKYSAHFQGVMEKDLSFEFITRGGGSDPKNMPLSLLNDLSSLLRKAEEEIVRSDEPDREEILKRLRRVRCTPDFFLYDNYRYYYPDANDEDYIRLRDEVFSLADSCGIDYVGERWTLEQYKTEWESGLKNPPEREA